MKMRLTLLTALSLFIVACGPTDLTTPDPSASSNSDAASDNANSDTDESTEDKAAADTAFSVEDVKEKLTGCWNEEVGSVKFNTNRLPKGVDLAYYYYPNKSNPNNFQPSSLYLEGPDSFILNKTKKPRPFTYEFKGEELILTENGVSKTYSPCP